MASTYPGRGGTSILHQVTVTLTDAQIKTLPTTQDVLIVEAQGASTIIVPIQTVVVSHIVSTYTNVDSAAYYSMAFEDDWEVGQVTGTSSDSGGVNDILNSNEVAFIHGGASIPAAPGGAFVIDRLDVDDTENKGFYFHLQNAAAGNFTGGNAGNTLTIGVSYLTLNTSTGLFV
jgi:hypothetical protein